MVFINDVYFCARDAIRLLHHGDADLACSMDFLQWKDPPSTVDVYPYGIDGPPLSVRAPPHRTAFMLAKCLTDLPPELQFISHTVSGSLFARCGQANRV